MLSPVQIPGSSRDKCRQLTRPKKLADIEQKIRQLLVSYEGWRNQIPESLAATSQADKIDDTIEKLNAVADILGEIDLPLGFGRD